MRFNGSIELLRKLLSILLLALFGLPLVSPLFALSVDQEAGVPACCRRNGKHHCMMGMAERSATTSHSAAFSAPLEQCPYGPAVLSASHVDLFTVPVADAIYASLVSHPTGTAQTESRQRIARYWSRQKRGPPASFSL